ncbi:MAG TPA: hypothetical protein PLJ27_10180, partial [Polyangiaceae bacterium]|nr:hypothetical protein [Polyangiaceae bacterium]
MPNHRPEGYECGDNTKNECTDPDTCNGEGACVPNHQPDGTACSGGVCDQGQCSGGGTGGAGGASGSGGSGAEAGQGGSGASAGTSGSAGSGGAKTPPAADSDSDDGCGCRMTRHAAPNGFLVVLLMAMAVIARRNGSFPWRKLLASGLLVPVVSATACGNETDIVVPPDANGQGGSSADGGTDGAVGGQSGTGASAGV